MDVGSLPGEGRARRERRKFEATVPWGWVVLGGRRWLPAQHGPLSAALRQDSSGAIRWVRGEDVSRVEAHSGAQWAFRGARQGRRVSDQVDRT